MNQSYPCPHCGEYLEVPSDLRATPVRCASCQKVFTPGAASGGLDDIPEARPARRRHGVRDDDIIAPRRSRRGLWITLGIIFGLLTLACCGGFGWLLHEVFNPEWQTFDSKEEGFSAKFPGPVAQQKRATGRAGDASVPSFTAARELLQERYEIQSVKLTKAEQKKDPSALLNELADAAVSLRAAGKVSKPRVQRMQDGHEALEFAHKLHGDNQHLQARIILAGGKAYILTVEGPFEPNGSPWVEEFFDSFSVTQPAVPAAPAAKDS